MEGVVGCFKMAGDGFLEHVDRKETEELVLVRATGYFFVCFRLILLFRRYVIDSVSWEGIVPFRYSWSTL